MAELAHNIALIAPSTAAETVHIIAEADFILGVGKGAFHNTGKVLSSLRIIEGRIVITAAAIIGVEVGLKSADAIIFCARFDVEPQCFRPLIRLERWFPERGYAVKRGFAGI